MDFYGQKLCQHLNTNSIHLSFPEPFGTPLFSPQALKFLFDSYKTLKTLRRYEILHLTNHHLARFTTFLKNSICILTVHDLIRHFDRQGLATYIRQPTFRDRIDLWLDWQGIKRARHIIAISHHTKKDLISYAGIPEERITVVYHGIDHNVFYPRREPKPLDYPYILFVGSEHPRKNLAALLKAFHQLKHDRRFREVKLVKVGKAGGKESDFRAQTLDLVQSLGLADEVVFTDFVSEDMLANYYSHAECLVLPSLYEGFGWPPLEAMACGCPVIVSNVASLPEITGDAALKIEPHDYNKLASTICMILTDDRLKLESVSKGIEWARHFTWEKAAEETLKVYHEVERSVGVGYVPAEFPVNSAARTVTASVPVKAVILVGGEGTRLRPLTYYAPKPMVPVLNRPFLEHTVAYLKKHSVRDIVLALSYLPETIQSYFGDGTRSGVQLKYCLEDSPFGTAGAVKNAERYLNGTFVVFNGDIFSELDLADMLAFHRNRKAKVTIALTWVDNPCAFGVVETDSDGRVRRFIEKPSPDRATTNWINAGVYILEPEVLRHVPPNSHYMFEKGLFPLLLELGEPIYGYSFNGYWLDMGTPEKYLQLNCDLLLGKTGSALIGGLVNDEVHSGESVVIHPSAEIIGPAIVGSNCSIGRAVHISGPVVIASNCHIGEGAIIEKTVLWKGVNIGRGASLKQCVVGNNTTIGDNAQIIDRMVVSDKVKIAGDERLEMLATSHQIMLTPSQATIPANLLGQEKQICHDAHRERS
jgi:mannose-1-phosphate guanylyltransferase